MCVKKHQDTTVSKKINCKQEIFNCKQKRLHHKVLSNPPKGSIEPLKRLHRTRKKGSIESLKRPQKGFYRTPVNASSEPQGFYWTFRVEPPPIRVTLLELSLISESRELTLRELFLWLYSGGRQRSLVTFFLPLIMVQHTDFESWEAHPVDTDVQCLAPDRNDLNCKLQAQCRGATRGRSGLDFSRSADFSKAF